MIQARGLRVKLERRLATSKTTTILIRVLSVILSLPLIGICFAFYGVNPLDAYVKIFSGGFGSAHGVSETIVKMLPIGLCALGLALAYKARILNIGAEGQLIMGSIAATWVALYSDFPPNLTIPIMLLAGFTAGATWALIPALLRTTLKVNEVIVTLMMNYVSLSILNYLVTGPWRGAAQWGFPQTDPFPSYARLPLLTGTRIHYHTLIILLALTLLFYVLIRNTTIGYEIKLVGSNPNAATYAGVSVSKIILLVMVLSGGLAGIAGVGEVAGIQGRLMRGISPGHGYTAIIPAWLGGLDPLATLVASFFISGLMVGGDRIQVSLGLPAGIAYLFNGMILIFVITGEFLTRYRVSIEMGGRRIWI
jgi:simple sugar transport system permease protein